MAGAAEPTRGRGVGPHWVGTVGLGSSGLTRVPATAWLQEFVCTVRVSEPLTRHAENARWCLWDGPVSGRGHYNCHFMTIRAVKSLSSRSSGSQRPRQEVGAANTHECGMKEREGWAPQAPTLVAPRKPVDGTRAGGMVPPSLPDQKVKGTPPRRYMSPASSPRPTGPELDLLCFGGLTRWALFPLLPTQCLDRTRSPAACPLPPAPAAGCREVRR